MNTPQNPPPGWIDPGKTIDVPSHHTPSMTQDDFTRQHRIVKEGKETFIKVGLALMEIRDRRGYQYLGYRNFEEYCEREHGFSRQQGYRLMDAAAIATNPDVTKLVTLENEAQARTVKQVGVDNLMQAAAELQPHYEPHEDAEASVSQVQRANKISLPDAKRIIQRAKEIKNQLKSEKRDARRAVLAENAKTFDRVASVGLAEIHRADSRKLHEFVKPDSVQLVVTSPPYNVGMPYTNHDDAMGDSDYAALLQSVFAECLAAMCDGARIAVVVPFGVWRNPWRPLASVAMDHLMAVGFTLRGQIVWDKGVAARSNTAWGSFRLPTNPCLRDTSECIIIAQKGTGALVIPDSVLLEDEVGRYSPFLKNADEFLSFTQDHWPIQPENAQRVGHPAPFPVELVSRLIRLYAYPGAFILDPFCGSGSAGVAAIRLGCRAKLIDIDAGYCALARDRCNQALKEENSSAIAPGWSKAAQDAVTAFSKRKTGKGQK